MNNFAQIFHTENENGVKHKIHVVLCKVSHWDTGTIFNLLTFFTPTYKTKTCIICQ